MCPAGTGPVKTSKSLVLFMGIFLAGERRHARHLTKHLGFSRNGSFMSNRRELELRQS